MRPRKSSRARMHKGQELECTKVKCSELESQSIRNLMSSKARGGHMWPRTQKEFKCAKVGSSDARRLKARVTGSRELKSQKPEDHKGDFVQQLSHHAP